MTARARVLHILKFYRPDFSGEGIFLERCSAAMSALDPSVEHHLLVTLTPAPAIPAPVRGVLPRLIYLSRSRLPVWRHELALVIWCLRNLHRYRVVHVRTHVDWYFLSYLLARLFGCRLVLSATLDDSVPVLVSHYRPSLRRLAHRCFRLFDAFVSISPKLQRETAAMMPPSRCHLLENGFVFPPTDHAAGRAVRARLGIPPEALVLIFVGGLCERKDPLLLLRNHAAILQSVPDCWLLLVGPELEADYVAGLRRTTEASGIAARVVFVGEVTDPHPWFAAADILVFASRLEGFGMVVPEAMGHALPVVVRALPGVNDSFVQDGETGFLFEDDAGYRRAVLRLAADPQARRQMGARAQRFVHARYDLLQVARRYLTLYGFAPATQEATALPGPVPAMPPALAGPARTAAILDPRFHTPTPRDPASVPVLLVLVDAEEAFDWGKPFSRSATDVSAMRCQAAAHRIYQRYGVRPTYLLDYPVAAQEEGCAPLRELLQDGCCDLGAQLHPWVSPPFAEDVNGRNSFAGNLPLALEYEKLRLLTQRIGEAFGMPPRIYRAGRYGVGPRTAEILLALGFEADSSTMPCWDFSRHGGPDYSTAPAHPYWLDTGRQLLEIPNAAALVGRLARDAGRGARLLFQPPVEALGIPSGLARLGLLERIKLTPEGTTPNEAKRLIRHLLAGGQRVFVMTYHSTSLQPGNTPYVRTAEDLRRFLDWLDEVLDFFQGEVGGRFATWHEVRHGVLAAEGRTMAVSAALPAVAG
jgi:glycosyltransferase involved in cell wall biosynthesis